jgi:hypothetical protein
MRTLKLTIVGTVTLALLGGLAGAVAAQSEEADVIVGPSATWVTFTEQECSVGEVTPVQDGAIQRTRGVVATCDVTMSDPRVSGTATVVSNYDCHAEAGCVTWGTQELVGPDGSWIGSYTGTIDAAFTERGFTVLNGTAGYEGLTFIVHATAPLGGTPPVAGIIYEGEVPPSVEPAD